MTGVIAYLAMVIPVAALLCCHQGEGAPPGARALVRVLRRPRPSWAVGPVRARRYARLRQESR
ncbi:hypothetical protein K4B79_18825 [Streptomyces lincolnensis]|uniref:hypothetical protein n=1 Tax=Streptomyces lincolnensis TaxID=1915 RepID=UPI001E53FE63|nr:hypothetical protein [Streptomyces lincolnensis]MCD7440270.1 hypothetical protein [Streptomyces lincolnensis]